MHSQHCFLCILSVCLLIRLRLHLQRRRSAHCGIILWTNTTSLHDLLDYLQISTGDHARLGPSGFVVWMIICYGRLFNFRQATLESTIRHGKTATNFLSQVEQELQINWLALGLPFLIIFKTLWISTMLSSFTRCPAYRYWYRRLCI